MARPRSSEHDRRETAFRTALIANHGDVEQAKADSGIADRHIVRLMNQAHYAALVHGLKSGIAGPTAVILDAAPLANAA